MKPGPVIVGIDRDAAARDAFALGQCLAELLDTSVDVVAISGTAPDKALRSAGGARHASFIVFGPTRRRSVAQTLRGTARRLLAESPCPLAIAPAGFADRPPTPVGRIGVGFEPTPEGAAALAVAHRLAARAGGTLRAIGVVLPLSPLAIDDLRDRALYLENERRIVLAALERGLAELPGDVSATADARVGDPAVELASASRDFDLLVCGSRGRGPVRAIVLGSVTERLLRGADCPLVIVPRPAGQPRRPPRAVAGGSSASTRLTGQLRRTTDARAGPAARGSPLVTDAGAVTGWEPPGVPGLTSRQSPMSAHPLDSARELTPSG